MAYKDPEQKKAYQRAYYAANREACLQASRNATVTGFYGLTLGQHAAMLKEQDGVCAICRNPSDGRRLDIDHDHTTHKVRGLLCRRCNTSIGRFEDSPALLRAAAEYLERNSK